VTLTVTDSDGSTSTKTAQITVSNAVPIVNAGSDKTSNEGSVVSFSGGYTDLGVNDAPWTITWDFGDGGTSSGILTPTNIYIDNGVYIVTLTVTDKDGESGTDTLTVTISNVAPQVMPPEDSEREEGATIEISAFTFTDPGTGDKHTATIDWGDETIVDLGTITSPISGLSHAYADNGVYTVKLTITDKDGDSGSASMKITVNNVAPTVNAGNDAEIDEGGIYTAPGSFADPGADTWTATVDYGDGGGTQPLTLNEDKTFSLSHKYADNGVYTVIVKVLDDDEEEGMDTVTIKVNNVAPKITSMICPLDPTKVGTLVTFTVGWADPGLMDTQSVAWFWGDGSSSTINAKMDSGSSAIQHAYLSSGVYTVSVTVTDKDGGSDSKTCEYYVVVYDPNGGFVTGGGWIWSPKGAYTADPTLEGKATFGFVSKYQKGANVPSGNTEFQFHAGNLNFKSAEYEWLVVTGDKAIFKGSGTINSEGNYKFMLWAGDSKSGDTFRIKIWTENNGMELIIYDNGSEQLISGGSIVIHK